MSPTHADYGVYRGPSDRIMPRNQQEAGIEYHQWENRLRPQMPWLSIIAIAAAIAGSFLLLAVCAWGRDALQVAGLIN